MAAWDLYCFQYDVIGCWNNWADCCEDEYKPCRLIAYRGFNGRSIAVRGERPNKPSVYDRLRPRPGKQGPFLPLLNYEGALEYMTQDPPYDPALFDWRRAGTQKNGKGGVTRKQKAGTQQPRPAKKAKQVDELKNEKKELKSTSKAKLKV